MARWATTGHEHDRTAAIVTSKALLAYYAENGRRGIANYRHVCGLVVGSRTRSRSSCCLRLRPATAVAWQTTGAAVPRPATAVAWQTTPTAVGWRACHIKRCALVLHQVGRSDEQDVTVHHDVG